MTCNQTKLRIVFQVTTEHSDADQLTPSLLIYLNNLDEDIILKLETLLKVSRIFQIIRTSLCNTLTGICQSDWKGLTHLLEPWQALKASIKIKIAKLLEKCDGFCVYNLRDTTFVVATTIVNFCLNYCNWQLFMHYCNF